MKDNRLGYIDMAKGIGIILVVLGHIVYVNEYVRVVISGFHMPLFFVISGMTMFLSSVNKKSVAVRIKQKVNSVVVPYMCFSLIYMVVGIISVKLGLLDIKDFTTDTISSLTFYGKSVMWFLSALFIAQVMLILLQSVFDDRSVVFLSVITAVLCCILSGWITDIYDANADSLVRTSLINVLKVPIRGGVCLPFVMLGYYGAGIYRKHKERLRAIYWKPVISLVSFAITVLISLTNWSVDTGKLIFNDPLLYYLGGIFGSISVLFFCLSIPYIKILGALGKRSLVIMAVHIDLYVMWGCTALAARVYGLFPYMSVYIVFTVISTLIVSCFAAYMIERFFPFILGRKKRRA